MLQSIAGGGLRREGGFLRAFPDAVAMGSLAAYGESEHPIAGETLPEAGYLRPAIHAVLVCWAKRTPSSCASKGMTSRVDEMRDRPDLRTVFLPT